MVQPDHFFILFKLKTCLDPIIVRRAMVRCRQVKVGQ
jgi:hypothetical protein